MRACNSVIRNQNHILKCTLKTLLDNPSRTRERALSSLIGLCRKQCNGPMVQIRPKKTVSLPSARLPVDYTPICPPPIYIKTKNGKEVKEVEKVKFKTKSTFPKSNNMPYTKFKSKPRDPCEAWCEKQCCCVCCGISCCPQPKPTALKKFLNSPISTPCVGTSTLFSVDRYNKHKGAKSNADRCSRRCCISQQSSHVSPLTMSPLCCPPSVKTLAQRPDKCTPIVKSFRYIPPPVNRKKQNQHRQPNKLSQYRVASAFRYPSAPLSRQDVVSNICKSNMFSTGYFSNFCTNNNDREVDSPGAYTPLLSMQEKKDTRAGSLLMGANTQSLKSPTYGDKIKVPSQFERYSAPSEYSGSTLRSAIDDPFSVTTWKTSKPVRFTKLPKSLER